MVLLDLSPLKYREFRYLFYSQLISMLGSQMTMITIPFQVFALTQSTFQTGLVSAVELICLVSTALFGGALADKLDRRKIIISAEIVTMIFVVILAINSHFTSPSLLLIYILAGLSAAINGFHRPAFEALTPLLVPKNILSKVSSLMACKFVVAALIGPTIAGFLVANIGAALTYLVDALSFAISLAFLMRIAKAHLVESQAEIAKHKSMLQEIGDGARYIWSRKDILGSYIIDFFAMIFCMPQVLFPAFAQHYNLPNWLGALYASVAFGGMLATLVSRWTSSIKRLGLAIFCAAFGWSLSILLAGLVHSFWVLLVALIFAGIFDGYSGIFRMTMWNESIPDVYRGRLASFNMLSYTSGPLLGNTLMGFLGGIVGLHNSLAIGASISLVVMTLIIFLLPSFLKYRSNYS